MERKPVLPKRKTFKEVIGVETPPDKKDGDAAGVLKVVAWIVLGSSGYFALAGNIEASMFMFFAFIALAAASFFRK